MKKHWKKVLPAIACMVIAAAAVTAVLLIQSRQSIFNGSRVRNPDAYLLTFSYMNQEDSHSMQLNAGDVIHVEAAIDSGKVSVIIGEADAGPIYRSDAIEDAQFDVVIPESARYIITVQASRAKGMLNFTLVQMDA